MNRYASSVVGLAALAPTLFGLTAAAPSIPLAYCGTLNTASTSANFSTYQSEGLCYTFCNDDGYALGVLQANDCWCSNYVPGDTAPTSECEVGCPGYPTDYCGGDETYAYIKLDAAVSGTKGASSPTASSTSKTSPTPTPTSDAILSTTPRQTQPVEDVTETAERTSVNPTSSCSSSSSHSSPGFTASITWLTSDKSAVLAEQTTETSDTPDTPEKSTTPAADTSDDTAGAGAAAGAAATTPKPDDSPSIVTTVKTVTSNGQVIYQTITTTANASAGNGHQRLSGGVIAGIVIGILAVLALFLVGALLFRRHKKNQEGTEGTPLARAMARRGSSAGIMSKTGTISSSGYGMGMEEDIYAHRMSMKPMDPRLDPKQTFGLYRAASHDSINTLRDDHDYSRRVHQPGRVLRVTNMSPTDDIP